MDAAALALAAATALIYGWSVCDSTHLLSIAVHPHRGRLVNVTTYQGIDSEISYRDY